MRHGWLVSNPLIYTAVCGGACAAPVWAGTGRTLCGGVHTHSTACVARRAPATPGTWLFSVFGYEHPKKISVNMKSADATLRLWTL